MMLRLKMLKFIVFLIVAVFMTGAASAGNIDYLGDMTDWVSFSNSPIGQTFTAVDNSTLDTMSFYFNDLSSSAGADSLNIEIYSGIGFGGSSLGSENFILTAGTGLKTFDFINLTIDLLQNSTYSVQLTTTSRWQIGKNQWKDAGGNVIGTNYTGGQAIINGNLSNPDRDDLAFQVTTPVVPEPISSVLFVVGGSVLAGRRFMKKRK